MLQLVHHRPHITTRTPTSLSHDQKNHVGAASAASPPLSLPFALSYPLTAERSTTATRYFLCPNSLPPSNPSPPSLTTPPPTPLRRPRTSTTPPTPPPSSLSPRTTTNHHPRRTSDSSSLTHCRRPPICCISLCRCPLHCTNPSENHLRRALQPDAPTHHCCCHSQHRSSAAAHFTVRPAARPALRLSLRPATHAADCPTSVHHHSLPPPPQPSALFSPFTATPRPPPD